jgi:hypothetical protein
MQNRFDKAPRRGFAASIAAGVFAVLATGGPQAGVAAPPAQAGLGTPPAQAGLGTPPAQAGLGTPPAQAGLGTPPAQAGLGTPPAQAGLGTPPAQATFPSAEAGSQALFTAVQNDDVSALTKILGAGEDLVSSDDPAQDKLDRQQFVQKYQEMHRFARDPDGDTILYIGAENWPFPIPLVAQDGAWRFDQDAGRQEVLLRRIGENEMAAIDICRELIAAEKQQGGHSDAAGALLRQMRRNGGPVVFQAYDFRILRAGSTASAAPTSPDHAEAAAFIAYPAAYRSSGVMSFVVGQDGVVYQKDLGPDTAKQAAAMSEQHPDPTWTPVQAEP